MPIIDAAALEGLPTEALLARLARLHALEDLSPGAWTDEEIAAADRITFKDDPQWKPAYDAVKAALSHRENVPSSADRTRQRHQRAALNKSNERRNNGR